MELDVTVLTIIGNKVTARLITDGLFARSYCDILDSVGFDGFDYIVVSRGDEILWIVDGMTPGWYIPKSRQDVLDRYPELKGKF